MYSLLVIRLHAEHNRLSKSHIIKERGKGCDDDKGDDKNSCSLPVYVQLSHLFPQTTFTNIVVDMYSILYK